MDIANDESTLAPGMHVPAILGGMLVVQYVLVWKRRVCNQTRPVASRNP